MAEYEEEESPPSELLFDARLQDIAGMHRVAISNVTTEGSLAKQTPYEYLMDPYRPQSPNAILGDYPRLYNGE
ncbi:Hypothetical protein PHPALM_15127 [Phytophthora palmivora]|uniref:Uncharacterized protein n=1 Tax=Phytophthora palmivora TaxID=4796 RepID=A0A2P4XT04_9STRA|nr:Hypothetical protein PHPALM_15127 [Phytophthora palmivora]